MAVAAVRGNICQRGPPQSPPRGQQRQGFEHVGLARPVLADQQVELARAVQPAGGMVAKPGQGKPRQRHARSIGRGLREVTRKALAESWEKSPIVRNELMVRNSFMQRKARFFALFRNWHAPCNYSCICGKRRETD